MKLSIVFCFLSILLGAPICQSDEEQTLNVYNWANALPEHVIRQFEVETGIQVNYSTYTSNEVLYAKLKANPKAGYDIVVPSTYFVDRLRKQNMLQKIDKSKLKNINNLDPSLLHLEHDPDNNYSVPYLWNATGIVVNDQYHAVKDVSSWADLWNKKYRNQLLMLDDTREVFSIALLTLGFSPNDRDPKHIAKAFLKLKELMPNIRLFNTEAIHSIMIDEDITLGVSWSGEIARARLDNPHLQFVYPSEGFVLSIDSMVIPEIAAKGVLVSEFPIGTPALASHFPRRNRIISGLAMGTLVVEANLASGSLITAKLALDQGREVFAIPGSINSPLSKGCHALIRQGAKLVETPMDVLEELGAMMKYISQSADKKAALANLSPPYEDLLQAVGFEVTSVDLIVLRSGLTADKVSSMLLELELQNYVVSVPGGYQRL